MVRQTRKPAAPRRARSAVTGKKTIEQLARERRVAQIRALPGQPGIPEHKSIEQLAREQGIPDEAPDYVELFSQVWRTKKEAADFRRFIRSMRRPSRD